MKELFDLDYLGKDLTGNAEIQTSVDRVLAFMKLEKWDKALDICEELIDLHPESPCGWFGKARLVSKEFTLLGLHRDDCRTLISTAAESLDTAIKVVEEERKEEYRSVQAKYSDRLKTDLVSVYIKNLSTLVDNMENLAETAKKNLPVDCQEQVFVACTLCELWEKILANKSGTIYDMPYEILEETANDYLSLKLAMIYRDVLSRFCMPYYKAYTDRNTYFMSDRGSNEVASKFAYDGGTIDEFSTPEQIKKVRDKYLPVYKYYKPVKFDDYTLASFIKSKISSNEDEKIDENIQEVFRILFRLFNVLNMPFGDLKTTGIPDRYYKEIEADLEKIIEQERTEKEKRKKEEQEKREQEKAREEAAVPQAQTAERPAKIKNIVLIVIVALTGYYAFQLLVSGAFIFGIVALVIFLIALVFFIVQKKKTGQK